jgi:hypothetical protein
VTTTTEYARRPCNCGYCDGLTVSIEELNPRTGSVETTSFERMSRRTECPVCGGFNERYRSSYVAHVAELIRRLDAHTSEVRFLTIVLDKETAEEADIDGWEESYEVLTGRGGVWTKARRRLQYRDPDLTYAGTITARVSDGRAHAHLVLATSLSLSDIEEALHVPGADVHVTCPEPTDSAAGFAACCANYAFQNHVVSSSGRFVASRSDGAGYDSAKARRIRREAVESRSATTRGRSGEGSGSIESNDDAESPKGAKLIDSGQDSGYNCAPTLASTFSRAPPVRCRGDVHQTQREYTQEVERVLEARLGSRVPVQYIGPALLVGVEASTTETANITAVIRSCQTSTTHRVCWRNIAALNPSRVQTMRPTSTPQRPSRTGDSRSSCEPIRRFVEASKYSRVLIEKPDGTTRKTLRYHDQDD